MIVVFVGGVVLFLCGGWWWLTRPPKVGEYVSQVWRDEHSRERRE